MPTVRAHLDASRETLDCKSFASWFDHELADVNAALARLEASLASAPPAHTASHATVRARKKRRTKGAAPERQPSSTPSAKQPTFTAAPGVAALPPNPAASIEPTPAAADVSATPSPLPAPAPQTATGADLSDPKNFGRLPPTAELEQGTASTDEYRLRLARHIAFATQVLHTSGVPAAVWREWRNFEKAARERARELAGFKRRDE